MHSQTPRPGKAGTATPARFCRAPAARASAAFLLLALALSPALGLSGCETVQFGDGTDTPGAASPDSASFRVSNRIETDPDKLKINLYRSDAQSIQDAPRIRTLGEVDTGKTATFRVPAGRFKLGYERSTGDLTAMPADTLEGGQQDWPAVTFHKDSTHFLDLYTDEGGVTVWQSDFYK